MKPSNKKAKAGRTPVQKPNSADDKSLSQEDKENGWLCGIGSCSCLVLMLSIYVRTLHPSVPGGDAGELIVAAHEFGVAHPPGYPLFTMLAQVAIFALPVGSVAWRVNLLTAILAAMASACLFAALYRLTGQASAGILGAGLFSLSRLTWQWAVSGEVFALNNCLLSILLLLLVRFHQDPDTPSHRVRMSSYGAFVCGLCLSNQHTSVVYVTVVALWVLTFLHRLKEISWRHLIRMSVCFLAGLTPYIYLPVSAHLHRARWTWGDQRTVWGVLKHLSRQEYGTFDLLQGHSGQGMLHSIGICVHHVVKDLTPIALVLLGLSLPLTFMLKHWVRKGQVQVVAVCWAMLLLYLGLFTWRANLDTSNPLFLGVVERFWLQGDLIIVFLAAVAYSSICQLLSRLGPVTHWKLDSLLAAAFICFQMQRNFLACDQSNNTLVRDFADQVLTSMPEGAIVMTKGDLPSNSLRYLHLCEGVRPDLTLLDQEVLTLEWSVPMTHHVYPNVTFPGDLLLPYTGAMPDGRQAFDFKTFLDANYKEKRPMFGCIGLQDHEKSWESSYELWPFGICHQLIRKGSQLHLDDWVAQTRAARYRWTYPLEGYDNRSWERVATEEMWSSRTAAALFLLEKSDMFPVGKERSVILTHSYQLYKEAMALEPGFPAYWHKNLALVCEKLSRADGEQHSIPLLRESAEHFSLFLELDPLDSDADKIRDAIKSLNDFVVKAEKTQDS